MVIMGFRNGAYATVWEVEPKSDKLTKVRISISRKNKTTGEYIQDFNGYVSFLGTLSAGQALKLRERDRIKLGDVDTCSNYVKEKNTTYYNFNVYSFELCTGQNSSSQPSNEPQPEVDDGEIDDGDLPF